MFCFCLIAMIASFNDTLGYLFIFHFMIVDVSRLSDEGEMPLLEMKQKVHILSEKTAQELKKNVYKNYSQFIETAREISSILKCTYQNVFHIHLVVTPTCRSAKQLCIL